MEIDFFAFSLFSPESFHKDVVIDQTTTVHADFDSVIQKNVRKFLTRKLNTLVRVKYLRTCMFEGSWKASVQNAVSNVVESFQERTYD